MAIAPVPSQFGKSPVAGATATYTFPSNVAVGDLVVITGHAFNTGAIGLAAGDVTKSAGTATIGPVTLDAVGEAATSGQCAVGIWSCIVTGAGSLTLQLAAGGSFTTLTASAFTGNWDQFRVEHVPVVASTTADNTTSGASNNGTSKRAALFVSALALDAAASITVTPDATFTPIAEEEDGFSFQVGAASYRIVTGPTTAGSTYTFGSANGGWLNALVVYRERLISYESQTFSAVNDTYPGGAVRDVTGISITAAKTLLVLWSDPNQRVATNAGGRTTGSVIWDQGGANQALTPCGVWGAGGGGWAGCRIFKLDNPTPGASKTIRFDHANVAQAGDQFAYAILAINESVSLIDYEVLEGGTAGATDPYDLSAPAMAVQDGDVLLSMLCSDDDIQTNFLVGGANLASRSTGGGDTLTLFDYKVAASASETITYRHTGSQVAGGVAIAAVALRLAVEGPTITAQPAHQEVHLGGNAAFSVTATGAGTLRYQWRLNGQSIPGANASTVILRGALPADTGKVDVVISDDNADTTSSVAELTVVGSFSTTIDRQPWATRRPRRSVQQRLIALEFAGSKGNASRFYSTRFWPPGFVVLQEGNDTLTTDITAGGGSGVNITSTLQEGQDQLATSTALAIAASASLQERPDQLATSTTLPVAITATLQEQPDTASASVAVAVAASAALTELGDQLTTSITVTAVGLNLTATLQEAGDTLASALAVAVATSAALQEGLDTAQVSIALPVASTAVLQEARDTLAATVLAPISASVSLVEAGDTLASSAGAPAASVSASLQEAGDQLAASATLLISATGTLQELGDQLSASVSLPIAASAGLQEGGDVLAASLGSSTGVSADLQEDRDRLTSSTTLPVAATAALQEAGDQASIAVALPIVATSSLAETRDQMAFSAGAPGATADAFLIERGDTLTSSVTLPVSITGTLLEVGDQLAATGALPISATVTLREAVDQVACSILFERQLSATLTEQQLQLVAQIGALRTADFLGVEAQDVLQASLALIITRTAGGFVAELVVPLRQIQLIQSARSLNLTQAARALTFTIEDQRQELRKDTLQ